MKANFEYDDEVDILYIYNPEYKGDVLFSIDIDNSVLDIGKKGKIVGIELIDASLKFSTTEEEKIASKEALQNIKECFFKVNYEINSIIVRFGFFALVKEQHLKEGMTIQVPIRKELIVKA